MMLDDGLLLQNARTYAKCRSMRIISQSRLGYGSDGTVWRTTKNSAVKVLHRQEVYWKEFECYRRLQAAGVEKLVGFNVPWLVGWDHELRVIEMTIVQAPYILDFGKVYIDAPPPYLYDKQMMKNVYAEWRDRYGSKWNEVVCAVEVLKKYGIFYVDPRRSNIDPGDEDEDPLPSDLAGYEDELAE